MKFLFSPSTNGFYCSEINGENIPIDSVEVSEEIHAELMEGQSIGKQIVPNENGFPILIEVLSQVETTEQAPMVLVQQP